MNYTRDDLASTATKSDQPDQKKNQDGEIMVRRQMYIRLVGSRVLTVV